jgi:hypothetical protein
MTYLKEGDVIRLSPGDMVYMEIPEMLVYENRRASKEWTRHEVKVDGIFSWLADLKFVVTKTASEGGGAGHGPHDEYPNGHHVYCESMRSYPKQSEGDGREILLASDRIAGLKIDFYQSGCFTAMVKDIEPIGHARRSYKWTVGKEGDEDA